MGASLSVVAAADECPVDHDKLTPDQLAAIYTSPTEPSINPTPPTSDSAQSNACPVDHENMTPDQIKDAMARFSAMHQPTTSTSSQSSTATSTSDPSGPTPSQPTKPDSKEAVYDVYGQELDSTNLMPVTPNQLPSPGQTAPLSTERVRSSIPKSGAPTDSTWAYPSPQMFFNALKRKGKAQDVSESDMDTVVAVHNSMNERTWDEVRAWEARFHCDDCSNPKLKRFQGRPHDLSPTARFRMWFRGYPRPFDRHDWVVDRCGLADVRYIIDYYYMAGSDPIEIHVRPAIDSLSAAADRLSAGYHYFRAHYLGLTALPVSPALLKGTSTESVSSPVQSSVVEGEELDEGEFSFLAGMTADGVSQIATDVQKSCTKASQVMAEASQSGDEEAFERANISLNFCMAKHICPPQATEFMTALESGGNDSLAYTRMTDCLDRFHIVARRAMLEATGVKQSGPEFPAGVVPRVASTSPTTAAPDTE